MGPLFCPAAPGHSRPADGAWPEFHVKHARTDTEAAIGRVRILSLHSRCDRAVRHRSLTRDVAPQTPAHRLRSVATAAVVKNLWSAAAPLVRRLQGVWGGGPG